ncbi:MAG TPA: WecB/TagA/CpsF family glycosyltransferase [Pirellulales bacterium]|jgi:N-acetylglucosaminyldiphosphoundecaprenol N-acetyl-beta-D-mannosaminyltransferase
MSQLTSSATLPMLDAPIQEAAADCAARIVSVLGVHITDVTKLDAFAIMERLLQADNGRCHSLFLVNAHTLNVATEELSYRKVLNEADYVFNDGTGVRWASRQRGIELRANLCGTDLIPEFFVDTANRGYRYYLLGATRDTIEGAAAYAQRHFPGWTQAGFHDGYVHNPGGDRIIDEINASGADLLLVGMGNPLQERWIIRHQDKLQVPLAIGVGGLFDHWVGKPRRAPLWVRRAGCEWMHKLMLQPHKARRYVLGNPLFIYRMTRALKSDLAAMNG